MARPSLKPLAPTRRLSPSCRGGVSSLLRLTPTGGARQAAQSTGWAHNAMQALTPFLPTDHDSDPLFTPLQPSPGVVRARAAA
jgi:hypothetical protein